MDISMDIRNINMEELAMCRVCLAGDVRMHLIANTHLQKVYESLTLTPLMTKDSRPVQVCYICCAGLQNCYRLRKRCLQTEELLTQALSGDLLQPAKIQVSSCTQRLKVVHPVIQLSVGDEVQDNETTEDGADGREAPNIVDNVKVEMEDAVDIKIEVEDTTVEENDREPDSTGSLSQSADDICPNLYDTGIGAPVLKKLEETTSLLVVKSEDKPFIISGIHDTINRDNVVTIAHDKVHQQTSNSNVCSNRKGLRLKVHLKCPSRTRASDKRFECDVCKKCFRKRFNFERHIRTHTGEKPYKCDVCKKCYSQQSSLNSHIHTHVGEKPYMCNVCKKRFSTKCYLESHTRIHTGEKPYMCDVCKTCFSSKSTLINHSLIHKDVKPFSCGVCNKSFRRKDHLKCHTRLHTGGKPYMCDVCKTCFGTKSNLIRHTRVHTHWCEKVFV